MSLTHDHLGRTESTLQSRLVNARSDLFNRSNKPLLVSRGAFECVVLFSAHFNCHRNNAKKALASYSFPSFLLTLYHVKMLDIKRHNMTRATATGCHQCNAITENTNDIKYSMGIAV